MPDLFVVGDYEASEKTYHILLGLRKLCERPDCTQLKTRNSKYCYCHDKESKNIIDLNTHYRGVL
jgi:hypothetical protein